MIADLARESAPNETETCRNGLELLESAEQDAETRCHDDDVEADVVEPTSDVTMRGEEERYLFQFSGIDEQVGGVRKKFLFWFYRKIC